MSDFDAARAELVERLRDAGVEDDRVLTAMADVPRHLFVDKDLRRSAYANRPLAIGEGQTISQPFMVAFSSAAIGLTGIEKVLEIGTGSGYQAAVVSRLAAEVHTVERRETLAARARLRLEALGFKNVICHQGDGTLGLPAEAPFDAILVTAAGPSFPLPLVEQLAPGGRLVIPIGSTEGQILRRLTQRPSDEPTVENLADVRYVRLVGEHGWQE